MSEFTTIYFKKAGMYTTVQDRGRSGYQQFGVPVGGAMDHGAMVRANRLVGNHENAPVLEITMIGPEIEIRGEALIAITGALFSPILNGRDIKMDRAVVIEENALLSLGRAIQGCRSYLAIAGKWQIQSWLGSTSPSVSQPGLLTPDSILQKGSTLKIVTNGKARYTNRVFKERSLNKSNEISILPGPDFNQFSEDAVAGFMDTTFKISPDSNRMGYRLMPLLEILRFENEIISSGVIPGTIQITSSGQPIILMRDAQTTGGYPRFANILSKDLDILAQMKPGDEVKFLLKE